MTVDPSPIPRRPQGTVELPLSALQRRMWFLCTAYPGRSSPIVFLSYRIRGHLDVDSWVRAATEVVRRHEVLRATFPRRGEGAVQVIGPVDGFTVDRVDLTDLPPEQREDKAREIVVGHTQALLDLEHGPLVTACLIQLGGDDHAFCFAMHHLVTDGASVPIVSAELRGYYQAFTGTPGTLPDPLPIGYGDYALWQQGGPGDAAGVAYWRDQLAGVPALDLPTDNPRPAEKGTRGQGFTHPLPAELTAGLDRLAATERCTPFMVLLAGFQALLAQVSGQDDFCVGTPIAGRTRVELEPLVGLFSNTVPLRADLAGDPSFRELLTRTRRTAIDALDYQEVPFGEVVAALAEQGRLPHDPSRTQVFQVIFVLHTEMRRATPVPGLDISHFPVGSPQILHDVVLDVWRVGGTLHTDFRYDSALFHQQTMVDLAQRYERLLRAAVDNPDAHLSALGRT